MNKKRIVISANSSWNLYNFRKSLILTLIKDNYEVICITPEDNYLDLLLELGCKHFSIKIKSRSLNPINDLKFFIRTYILLRRIKPLCILTFTIKPNIYFGLVSRIQKQNIIQNVSGLGSSFLRESYITRFVEMLYRISFKKSKHAFYQNHTDRELFLRKSIVRNENSSVVPGSGVNIVQFNCGRKENKGSHFLFVGRILKDKGIIEFINAAKIVSSKYQNIKFSIVGEVGVDNPSALKRSELMRKVNKSNISFFNHTNNIKGFYAKADVFVLPSYREGLSRALLEAASMRLPLITTNVPGCKELVNDSENGVLIRPKDTRDLVNAMESMILQSEKVRLEMGEASRKLVKRNYSEGLVIRAYLEKIKDLNSLFE